MRHQEPVSRGYLLMLALVLAALLSARRHLHAGEDVKLEQVADKGIINVSIGGKPFTVYRFAPPPDGSIFVRPYLFPVMASDGVEVTSDQSQVKGGDHPHHRSIWVAHGEVNGLNHWMMKDKNAPQQRHKSFVKVEGDTIQHIVEWDGEGGKPMIRENRTWRFFAYADGSRGIDLTSVYEAVGESVLFADTKEAGLCSVRVTKDMAKTSIITESTGATSKDEKTEEKNCWGKKADWCDLSGTQDGKGYGVTIFDHPSNPRHPSTWHVRNYGLMSANIFGLHEFDKKTNPVGAGNFTMELGKPQTFRYRLVIHTGLANSTDLQAKYQDYSDGK